MKQKYLVGIDVGTTGTNVVIFDLMGKQISSAYQEYVCIYPQPNWVDQDCNMLIDAVYNCCAKAIKDKEIVVDDICGISVSAQRSCTVFLDKDGNPIKMISWLDNRATEQVEEIATVIGKERFYEITGMPLAPTWILPKILHTRKYDKDIWERTAKIVQLQDIILRALGVDGYYSDEPDASFWGFWDNRNFCFSKEIMDAFALDESLFPEILQSGKKVGKVTQEVAQRTGFAVGTPICLGIGDQNSAALGAGIVKTGGISVSIGTGGLATALLDECYRDPKGQAMVTNHAIHGLWTFEGLQNAAAGVFRWFRDELTTLELDRYGEKVYGTLDEMISKVPVGANGLLMLPFFAGSAAPRWNSKARGGFLGLTLSHTRSDMARACLEGITLEQKDIINSLSTENVSFQYVRIVGGATKSKIWNQMQADIYNLPCETLVVTDAAVLGAAICAGYGTGIFDSIEDAVTQMVKVADRYEPNAENAVKYEELYKLYCDVYHVLDEGNIFEKFTKIQEKS